MDTNDLLTHSRSRFDHHQARTVLREKYQAKLNFAHKGGMFLACPEMIVFLNLYQNDDIVIPDLYQNPVRVNAAELKQEMQSRFSEQMNAWLVEHEQLSQLR